MTAEDDEARDRECEEWLRATPLRRPSAALDRRVAAALHGRRRRGWPRVAAAVAAALAIAIGAEVMTDYHAKHDVAVLPTPPARPTATASSGRTLSAALRIGRTFADVADEGIVGRADNGDPVRIIRRQMTRRVLLIDPTTGRRVTVTAPRQDIVLVRQRAI